MIIIPPVIININFPAISIVNCSSDIVAAVVPTVVVAVFLIIVIVSVGFLFMYWKVRLELALPIKFIYVRIQGRPTKYIVNVTSDSVETPKFRMILVHKESNMIEFAKLNIEHYNPDSGKGYYQFTEANQDEFISSKTQVVLISEVYMHTTMKIIVSLQITVLLVCRMKSSCAWVLRHKNL